MKKYEPTRAEKALFDLLVLLTGSRETNSIIAATAQGQRAVMSVEHLIRTMDDATRKKLRVPEPLTTGEADKIAQAAIEEMMNAHQLVRDLKAELQQTRERAAKYNDLLVKIHALSR